MDLSTPWVPSLKGEECALCDSYQALAEARPNSITHTPWAEKTLRAELIKTPEARSALWESVLALWRLDVTGAVSNGDVNWRNLVSAWLYRHREICRYIKIAPYQVIVDYADRLRANKYLPAQMIPSWNEPSSVPSPEPEQDSKSASSPKPIQKEIEILHVVGSDDDVEMVEAAPPSITSSTQKERAQSNETISVGAGGSQVEQLNTENAKSEVALQESLSQVRRILKPVRERSMVGLSKGGLDMTDQTTTEETAINDVMFPKVQDQTCDQCVGITDYCRPTWHKTSTAVPIYCPPCRLRKIHCSFKDRDWEVAMWPQVIAGYTPAFHRKMAIEARWTSTSSAAGNWKESSNKSTGRFLDEILIPPPPLPQLRAPAPTREMPPFGYSPAAVLSTRFGSTQNIFLHYLDNDEEILMDPNRTPVRLRSKALSLYQRRELERGQLLTIMKLVEGRDAVFAHLINELLDEACFLEECDPDELAEALGQDLRVDAENGLRSEDTDIRDVDDPVRCDSRAAMEGIVSSEPPPEANTVSGHKVQESTSTGSDGKFEGIGVIGTDPSSS